MTLQAPIDRRGLVSRNGKSRHQKAQMYARLAAAAPHSPLLARVKKPRMPSLEGFAARVRSTDTVEAGSA